MNKDRPWQAKREKRDMNRRREREEIADNEIH